MLQKSCLKNCPFSPLPGYEKRDTKHFQRGQKIWSPSLQCPSLLVLDSTRSLNHRHLPSPWHLKALSDRWLAPSGPVVWTRCCDDKTLLAAIREQRVQSSISPSSNPRSSIDFSQMRNGRLEKAQSDMPMGPVHLCVCVHGAHECVWESTWDLLEPRQGDAMRWIH